jgi:hypothetical protein
MNTFWKIVFIVVVAAVVIGVGVAVFNAGIAQGMVLSGQLPAPDGAATAVSPYYAPHYRPWGWGFAGFGCFAVLGLFLLFPLIFGLGRLAFGPRHGWRYGPWGGPRGFNGEQVPPFVDEVHRKMHEKMNQPPAAQA